MGLTSIKLTEQNGSFILMKLLTTVPVFVLTNTVTGSTCICIKGIKAFSSLRLQAGVIDFELGEENDDGFWKVD